MVLILPVSTFITNEYKHFVARNEVADKMAKNGKFSCSSKSRHIGINLFWVYYRVEQGKISVKHCFTNKMLSDLFTKYLNGRLFHKIRYILTIYKHISKLLTGKLSIKERVGDKKTKIS